MVSAASSTTTDRPALREGDRGDQPVRSSFDGRVGRPTRAAGLGQHALLLAEPVARAGVSTGTSATHPVKPQEWRATSASLPSRWASAANPSRARATKRWFSWPRPVRRLSSRRIAGLARISLRHSEQPAHAQGPVGELAVAEPPGEGDGLLAGRRRLVRLAEVLGDEHQLDEGKDLPVLVPEKMLKMDSASAN